MADGLAKLAAATALFLCVACVSTPSPTIDFGSVNIPEVVGTAPVTIKERPELIDCQYGFVCFETADLDLYEAILIAGEANHDIASNNAEAINELNIATQELVKAGKQAGHINTLQQDQLRWRLEQKQRDVWVGYGIILVLGLALAL